MLSGGLACHVATTTTTNPIADKIPAIGVVRIQLEMRVGMPRLRSSGKRGSHDRNRLRQLTS
jgi:hypothetical protein